MGERKACKRKRRGACETAGEGQAKGEKRMGELRVCEREREIGREQGRACATERGDGDGEQDRGAAGGGSDKGKS